MAKFWAADGGQRVVHAAVHLHGGVGVDRDYPLHRYFLMTKHLELTLGGATEQLLRLGAIAGRPEPVLTDARPVAVRRAVPTRRIRCPACGQAGGRSCHVPW